ncbi:hypothetical protein F4818DRAFT_396113 [Hypoxylon cercidicola]|nr:hypothetical protein F4818DRAFT_396113 [Hypoxylon cercidicola]
MACQVIHYDGHQLKSFKDILGEIADACKDLDECYDRSGRYLWDTASLKDQLIYVRDGPTNLHANEDNPKWITLKQVDFLERQVLGALSVRSLDDHDTRTESLRADIQALRNLFDSRCRFPRFKSLPPEIRAMIWDYAIRPRFVRLSTQRLTEDGFIRCTPPVTAQICRESRAVACRYGRLVPTRRPKLLFATPFGLGSGDETSESDCGNEEPHPEPRMNGWGWFDPSRDSLVLSYKSTDVAEVIAESAQHITLNFNPAIEEWPLLRYLSNPDVFPRLKAIDYVAYTYRLPEMRDPILETRLFGGSRGNVTVAVNDCDAFIQRVGADHSSHDLNRLKRLGMDFCDISDFNEKIREQAMRPRHEGRTSCLTFRAVVRFERSEWLGGSEDRVIEC